MSTRMPGRRRRPALVAGAVVTLAAASAATSLVPGATAAPAPARAAAAPAASTAPGADSATGPTARTRDGRVVTVTPGAVPDRRLAPSTAAVDAAGAAAAVTAPAAAIAPPAYSALGSTGLVRSTSTSLTFAPDGSRVAWATSNYVYSSRINGTGLVTVADVSPVLGLAWSPDGRFVAVDATNSDLYVVAAAYFQRVQVRGPQFTRVVSWLSPSTIVTLHSTSPRTFAVSSVSGAGRRSYVQGSGVSVRDAVASPDGTRVAAHVSRSGGGESVVVVDAATLRRVATVVTGGSLGRPAWSADSATVYVPRLQDAKWAIVSHPADTAAGEPTVVLDDAGAARNIYLRPTGYGAARGVRVTGRDAVAVSVARSKDAYRVSRAASCNVVGGATSAVLAATGSVEATVAAPLAARKCGAVLLTGRRSLDSRTATELKRLLRRGRTVYLVGNTKSLSPSIATKVARLGFKAVRYGGADVYATSVVVATKGFASHKVAAIASATQPLAAAAAAASTAGSVPLLLTKGRSMPKVTAAYIARYDVAAWVVGTQAVKAAPWAFRYVGTSDAATAFKVAYIGYYPPLAVGLVAAGNVSLVYAAAADATLRGYPLLVVTPKSLGAPNRTYVGNVSASVNVVTLFGSTKQVSSAVLTDAVKQAGGRSFR